MDQPVSRDAGHRTWEVRDVNVLLQQLERFEGVCILTSNRKASLDPALERRITLKVEFERPDQSARREIWSKLVPSKTPLADDVDFDVLSEEDFTGGEIKNVVLNAARLALQRGEGDRVTMGDFRRAVEMEIDGRLNRGPSRRIGFASLRKRREA